MRTDAEREADRRRSSRDYWARKTSGRCIERGCPNPASDTATRCEHHRQRFNARQERRRFVCALLGLVVAACGGVVAEPVEGLPVPLAESGVVRVAERDAGDGGHTIECTPDAEAHTGILCMHPKRQRRADAGGHDQ